mgnify:FL=1|tara:strand:+ start:670 stop:798 length:129 start_codon:yes stop_codon:yes gene_type:complete
MLRNSARVRHLILSPKIHPPSVALIVLTQDGDREMNSINALL